MTKPKKYFTLDNNEGCDFRKIASIMTKAGYKMNHATARNQLMTAIENVLVDVASDLGTPIPPKKIRALANDREVYNILQDVLYLAYEEYKQETRKQIDK